MQSPHCTAAVVTAVLGPCFGSVVRSTARFTQSKRLHIGFNNTGKYLAYNECENLNVQSRYGRKM